MISTLQMNKLRLRDVRQRAQGHGLAAEPRVRLNQGRDDLVVGEWMGTGDGRPLAVVIHFYVSCGTWHISSHITSTSSVSAG